MADGNKSGWYAIVDGLTPQRTLRWVRPARLSHRCCLDQPICRKCGSIASPPYSGMFPQLRYCDPCQNSLNTTGALPQGWSISSPHVFLQGWWDGGLCNRCRHTVKAKRGTGDAESKRVRKNYLQWQREHPDKDPSEYAPMSPFQKRASLNPGPSGRQVSMGSNSEQQEQAEDMENQHKNLKALARELEALAKNFKGKKDDISARAPPKKLEVRSKPPGLTVPGRSSPSSSTDSRQSSPHSKPSTASHSLASSTLVSNARALD